MSSCNLQISFGIGMADSKEKAEPNNGRLRAILPNPFVFSEEPDGSLVSPQSGGTDRRVQNLIVPAKTGRRSVPVLRAYVPNSAGELPQPVPTLSDYDQPLAAMPIVEDGTSEVLPPEAHTRVADDSPKLRGIGLLGAVFDVLSSQLGNEYSTAELMRAAQQLIDIAKSEYVEPLYRDTGKKAGYYSWDLSHAFSAHPWHIVRTETHLMDHCDMDEFSPESFESAKFIIQGRGELTWDF
jgi:hypothetical protein